VLRQPGGQPIVLPESLIVPRSTPYGLERDFTQKQASRKWALGKSSHLRLAML
jgi:hypothetical protein